MTGSMAVGIASHINDDKFTDKEKAEAIWIVMKRNKFHDINKKEMGEVIEWLFNRCFRVRKKAENKISDAENG